MSATPRLSSFFFFNDTATTEIYTLSLHDALPISNVIAVNPKFPAKDYKSFEAELKKSQGKYSYASSGTGGIQHMLMELYKSLTDRKSTRLNSSHQIISYAVFCLKKKKNRNKQTSTPCRVYDGS